MYKYSEDNAAVYFDRPPPHPGSDLGQNKRLHCQDATVPEVPNAVELAAGHERAWGKAVSWTGEKAQLRCATVRLGNGRMVHLLVERLNGTDWDWYVWVQAAGWTWACYGLAETAEHARQQAEQVLMGLMLSGTDGNVTCAAEWNRKPG